MFRLEKQLMRMLTMNLNQYLAQFTQLRQRDGSAVDKTPRAAIAADDAAKQALASLFQLVFFQPTLRSGCVFKGKTGAQIGTAGPSAHHICFCTAAKAQPKGVNCDRFTCAGFTGDGGHPVVKVDFKLTNNSEVADGQLCQHSRFPVYKNIAVYAYSIYWFLIQ